MFDLRLDEIVEWIRGKGLSSVAVQLPEGLKVRALEIADHIFSKAGVPVTILGDPCYGSCDVRGSHRKIADGLVHFGHAHMPSVPVDENVLFIEATVDVDVDEGISRIAPSLPERIGLLATVQYIGALNDAKRSLEARGKKVVIGKGDPRLKYDGQVLGCNYSAAESVADEVDCFLFIGEGEFHPLAAALGIKKELFMFNPLTYELRAVTESRDRIMRKRFATIEKAKQADSFLVIECMKPGQRRTAVADDMMRKIIAAGKKAYKLSLYDVTPEWLLAYRVDAYVSTACPRLAMDESARFEKPILTPPEAEIVLGIREWEDYRFDAIRDQ
ncbi:MAG: diphthamide biosynthesis enzyme Dph2 [Methanomassiliicoccaceae archaeon]|nr:diphthamide biosynthesis enzyme Dph2 [Methanomassiliicoccaceae archaeon]